MRLREQLAYDFRKLGGLGRQYNYAARLRSSGWHHLHSVTRRNAFATMLTPYSSRLTDNSLLPIRRQL
jgi:hypothetical protein